MTDFGFGLFILTTVFIIVSIIYFGKVISRLKDEIEKLKNYIYELINSSGRGDN